MQSSCFGMSVHTETLSNHSSNFLFAALLYSVRRLARPSQQYGPTFSLLHCLNVSSAKVEHSFVTLPVEHKSRGFVKQKSMSHSRSCFPCQSCLTQARTICFPLHIFLHARTFMVTSALSLSAPSCRTRRHISARGPDMSARTCCRHSWRAAPPPPGCLESPRSTT